MNQQLIPDPFLILVNNPKQCVLVCHPHVTHMYSYVMRMSLVCTHVIRMSLVCTRMSSVCHSYVLVCHPYVTRIYSHVIRMSLVCGFTMNHLNYTSLLLYLIITHLVNTFYNNYVINICLKQFL